MNCAENGVDNSQLTRPGGGFILSSFMPVSGRPPYGLHRPIATPPYPMDIKGSFPLFSQSCQCSVCIGVCVFRWIGFFQMATK
jgi:hypothetical protein